MANKDEAEKMVGRAVIEAMKRSSQAREMFRRILGDVMENIPVSEEDDKGPLADVIETPEEMVVFLDLPGTKKEDINLGATEDSVSVEARVERPEGQYIQKERSRDVVKRIVKLPEEVKPEQVRAKYENGVLEVHLPKLIVVKPHEVNIE